MQLNYNYLITIAAVCEKNDVDIIWLLVSLIFFKNLTTSILFLKTFENTIRDLFSCFPWI